MAAKRVLTPVEQAQAAIVASLAAEGIAWTNPVLLMTAARCQARLDQIVGYLDGLPVQSQGDEDALIVLGSRKQARPHPLLVQENVLRNELRMHMSALREGAVRATPSELTSDVDGLPARRRLASV